MVQRQRFCCKTLCTQITDNCNLNKLLTAMKTTLTVHSLRIHNLGAVRGISDPGVDTKPTATP